MNYKDYVGAQKDYDIMRKWQYEYLISLPEFDKHKTFLDIGCGSMRLGAVLIPELAPEKYIGLDINKEMVEQGIKQECSDLDFTVLKPKFIYTDKFFMSEIAEPVHMAWAQAVFNHLNLSTVKMCLTNLHPCLSTSGVFYSTYWPAENEISNDNVSDSYNFKKRNIGHTTENMNNLYNECGFTFEHVGQTVLGQTIVRSVRA